ncbi:MAG: hypothetical protein P3M74_00230 [Candidatus Hodgkinia cicadicola]|nr:MAG: hypothetical protein P3M74_00230 [Candidatus Hodgkinia cicadicola]
MKLLMRGYNSVFKTDYQPSLDYCAPIALCLTTKFDKPESVALNKEVCLVLRRLGLNTMVVCFKPKLVSKVVRFTNVQMLNLQLALNWMMGRHNKSDSKWVVGLSLWAAFATHLIIRRPEVTNYVLVNAALTQANYASFELLSKLRLPGLAVFAENDAVTPASTALQLIRSTKALSASMLEFVIIRHTNHLFNTKLNKVSTAISEFYNKS